MKVFFTPSPKVTEPTASPKVTEPTATPNVTELAPSPEPAVTDTTEPTADIVYFGDIDCNGVIDVTDLTTLAIALVENEPLSGISAKNADVTHNGTVDLADLATLRQYLSKKIEKF